MLILPDKSSLGDTHLSPEEGVSKLKEMNQVLVDKKKMPNQSILENQDMAVGNPMQPSEFILKLKRMNPNIIVEPGGVPGAVAVRYPVVDSDPDSDTYGKTIKKYITGFYVDTVLSEFSSITVDSKGLPHREIRGWRSVLLPLIGCGALTYADVKAVFGEARGQRSVLWDRQTQCLRT